MELYEVWVFLRRRWYVVLGPTLVAFIVASYLGWRGFGAYKLTARLSVSVYPEPESGRYFPGDYYAWISSEYLADDLSEILKSRAFADDLSASMGRPIGPYVARDVIRTKKTHRIVEIDILGSDFADLVAMGEHLAKVLNEKLPTYLAQLSAGNARVNIIDPPRVVRANTLELTMLDILLKTFLGLVLGIGLAFLLHYADQAMYGRHEVEAELGVPVLAEIPAFQNSHGLRRLPQVRLTPIRR